MSTFLKLFNRALGLLLIYILVTTLIDIKLQRNVELKKLNEFTSAPKSYVSASNVDKTLECLAVNIYKEAGNESFEGKVAVAQVTLNRVDHPKFPKEVCGVVYQKNVFMEKVVCQFSWYCDANHKNKSINNAAYQESYLVAKKVLLEGFRIESLKDALYYHADYVNPGWPYQRIGKVGTHIFYRNKT